MTQLLEHPYGRFLHRVEKPNRYTGAEHGVRRKPWQEAQARVCLAFPDVYDIGMSHLGYRILYKILNDDPRTLAERCYAPWLDMQRELIAHGQMLVSLESARPLCDFDVVGFSLQYELTYTNILTMLDLGGIPLRAQNRSDDDPLVIAGGPVATHMEPMAAFFDAVLIGDGEDATTEIALEWVRAKREGLGRRERLLRLAQIRGVYVPSLYATTVDPATGFEVVVDPKRADVPFPIERRLLPNIDAYPFPDDGPVGGPEAIFERMSIEVARGCTEGCRFCQAGMIYRPVRERDPQEVVNTVLRALDKTGQDEVSLTALSTADVSCISPLIKSLVEKTAPERVSLGVASLRAYGLAEDLLDDMRKVRASGLTFAPEAGTQRMRDVINKNVTEQQLLETAERVFSRGFDKMKLYFIIGLPTEQDEDVVGIVDVGRNALAVGKRLGKRAKVTVSVSTHVPKPHTPFQWCAMDDLPEVQRKQEILRSAARKVKGLQLRVHDSRTSVIEGVLARGDRSLWRVIERVYLNGGRFDSWEDQLRLDLWQEAFEHFGVQTERYLGTIPVDARLPWDHFDIGLEDGFLAREYRKAVQSRLSPPCGKAAGMFIHHTNLLDAQADARRLVCYDCGIACDLTKMRDDRVRHLRVMNALEPRLGRLEASQPKPIPDPTEPSPLPQPEPIPDPVPQPDPNPVVRRHGPEAFRPQRTGKPERYRIRFAKCGASALLGHLDLIRELPRVVRRAGIKTWYSEGFHPKPDMSFGPALSLGVASVDEYVDMKLADAPDTNELVERLNRAASGGLSFLDARLLGPSDAAVTRVITGAHYVIALAADVVEAEGGRDAIRQRIETFLQQEKVVVRRQIQGVGKLVNVRGYVSELRLGEEHAETVLARAGIVGRVHALETTIQITQTGSAKVSELVQALFGRADVPHHAVRARMVAGETHPLDLATLRTARERPTAPAAAAAAMG